MMSKQVESVNAGQANLAHISREHSTAIRPQSRSMPIHMNVYINLPAGRRPPAAEAPVATCKS